MLFELRNVKTEAQKPKRFFKLSFLLFYPVISKNGLLDKKLKSGHQNGEAISMMLELKNVIPETLVLRLQFRHLNQNCSE